MSINEIANGIANDRSFIPNVFMIVIVCLIIAIPGGIIFGKISNKKIYGESSDSYEQCEAKVIGKRQSPHPLNQNVMINMVAFEFDSGIRREFAIKDGSDFGLMTVGDTGTLHYSGTSFIRFERKF